MKTFLIIANLLILLVGTSFGSTETIISKKNEYGGQTIETTYSKNDKKSEKLIREVTSLDRNGNIVKVEYFYTSSFSEKNKGASRVIIHVVNNYKIIMQEVFYTNTAANTLGLDKMILHYNDNDKLIKLENHYMSKSAETKGFYRATLYVENESYRIEYLCTSGFSFESGVDKFVAFLDKDKRLTRLEYFKDDQKLLLTDEKVALIKSKIAAAAKDLNF